MGLADRAGDVYRALSKAHAPPGRGEVRGEGLGSSSGNASEGHWLLRGSFVGYIRLCWLQKSPAMPMRAGELGDPDSLNEWYLQGFMNFEGRHLEEL